MGRTRSDAINRSLTEILSIEAHIDKAIRGQIEDFDTNHPEVAPALSQIEATIARHVAALEALCDRRRTGGSPVAGVVKRARAILAGFGAAAMDLIRTERLPNDLRDDYAAISLCGIEYVMLHTTACSLDDEEVAELARVHLADHARALSTLSALIPSAVIQSLRDDGLAVRDDVLPAVTRMIQTTWSGAQLARA